MKNLETIYNDYQTIEKAKKGIEDFNLKIDQKSNLVFETSKSLYTELAIIQDDFGKFTDKKNGVEKFKKSIKDCFIVALTAKKLDAEKIQEVADSYNKSYFSRYNQCVKHSIKLSEYKTLRTLRDALAESKQSINKDPKTPAEKVLKDSGIFECITIDAICNHIDALPKAGLLEVQAYVNEKIGIIKEQDAKAQPATVQ